MRPIVEMQFADFSSIALNQILNHAGTTLLAHPTVVSDHGAIAFRRNERERAVSQPKHGSDLRALPGAGRNDAGHGGGRLHDVNRCGRDRRPGHLLRAQISLLPSQGRRIAEGRVCQSAAHESLGQGAISAS